MLNKCLRVRAFSLLFEFYIFKQTNKNLFIYPPLLVNLL